MYYLEDKKEWSVPSQGWAIYYEGRQGGRVHLADLADEQQAHQVFKHLTNLTVRVQQLANYLDDDDEFTQWGGAAGYQA
tara:strand:+ start:252 stop:488 length:237 start_codon:yes stop_codon:yes gene_type:complete